jgi:NDP-sugar pyrophosphorylase family protein
VRYAGDALTESVVVFNGDVLTQVDLAAVLKLHRERKARATIVLTPVDNPTAYGLVETDKAGNILRFLEKPKPRRSRRTTSTPASTSWSRTRSTGFRKTHRGRLSGASFPRSSSAAKRSSPIKYNGYWIDIGTPEKYTQVHRDIMDGRYQAPPFAGQPAGHVFRADGGRVEDGAVVEGPCFLDADTVVRAGAYVGPYSVLGHGCVIEEQARVSGSIVWATGRVGQEASMTDAIAGRHVHVGRGAVIGPGALLGDKSVVTDYSRM